MVELTRDKRRVRVWRRTGTHFCPCWLVRCEKRVGAPRTTHCTVQFQLPAVQVQVTLAPDKTMIWRDCQTANWVICMFFSPSMAYINGANVFCFLSSLPFPPPHTHYDSVWLQIVISLLLSSTVSPVRACLSI
jgi:hypothetical protein